MLYKYLIIFLIILLLLCYYNSININFIKSKNIYNIFNNNNILDYLDLINDDMYDIRMNSDIYNSYEKNVLDFTINEKMYLKYNIFLLNIKLRHFKKFRKDNLWNLIKTRNNLEYGRPFTLDKYILLPKQIIFSYDIQETLLHEQFHIHQRLYQDKYNKLYEKYLDWYLQDEIIISDYIDKNMVVNPDGPNNNWYFYYNNYKIIPFLIYDKNYDIKYYILDNHKVMNEYKNTKEIDNYLKNKYNIDNNYYHPNEIISTILTEHILYNKKIDKNLLHFIN